MRTRNRARSYSINSTTHQTTNYPRNWRPNKAFNILIERVSQDDGLEVASLIAKVATLRYNGSDSVTSFLDSVNDLHTQLAEATADDQDLKISDKLLAVFLLLSFPSDQFSTIRDQLFGDLKSLSTAKFASRLRTKSALSSVDESVTAMATYARPTHQPQSRNIIPRTDRSPNAPCYLKEHWSFIHTNSACRTKRSKGGLNQWSNTATSSSQNSSNLSDSEKIRRFNQLAAAGVIGFNAEVQQSPSAQPSDNLTSTPKPQSAQPEPAVDCQYATSYNVTVHDESATDPILNVSTAYPPGSATNKPTLADTACNRHMFGEAMFLDNLKDISPVNIKVANADSSSSIVATKMGTARLHAFELDGTPTFIDITNVLYSPSLPANSISITQLYDAGFKNVDPH